MDISLKIGVGLMKLRNKKTGEICEVIEIITLNNRQFFRFKDNYGNWKKNLIH